MSATEYQKPQQEVTQIYSKLADLLTTLHTNAILASSHTQNPTPVATACHQFLLPKLQLLLTTQRSHVLPNLRTSTLSITQLSMSASQPAQTRVIFFGRALLWAIDHAEHLLSRVDQLGDTAELQILKPITTIFHLVARFCNQEWGLEQPCLEDIDEIDEVHATVTLPSKHDSVYLPTPRLRSKSPLNRPAKDITSTPNQMTQADDFSANQQNQVSATFFCGSHYIFGNGKLIMPGACMRESSKGCLVPFQVTLKEYENNNVAFDGPSSAAYMKVLYPDQTCFQYFPVQSIRLLHSVFPFFAVHNSLNDIAIRGDAALPMVSVEISSLVYATIIHLCQQAYNQRFPDTHILLPQVSLTIPMSREVIQIPVLPNCFVRVVDGEQVIEHPLQLALEMFQKDLCGCGLLKVEIRQELEGTNMVISLAGIAVEKNLLNDNDGTLDLI